MIQPVASNNTQVIGSTNFGAFAKTEHSLKGINAKAETITSAAQPKAELGFFQKVWNCFATVFKSIFCCFFKSDDEAVKAAAPAVTAPVATLSKTEQYATIIVADGVKDRKLRKEAIRQAVENLSPGLKAKIGEAYENQTGQKDASVLSAHLAKHKNGALDFVVKYAEEKWLRSCGSICEDILEIQKEDEKKAAKAVASTLMEIPELNRQAALIELFGFKGQEVSKMYQDEKKITKTLVNHKSAAVGKNDAGDDIDILVPTFFNPRPAEAGKKLKAQNTMFTAGLTRVLQDKKAAAKD